MSARRIFALLVVLALSLGLCSMPAGSATLQRTSTIGGNNGDPDTAGDDEDGEGDDNVRMLGRLGMLQVELRALFGFLVMML